MNFKLSDLEFELEELSDQECKALTGAGMKGLKSSPTLPEPPPIHEKQNLTQVKLPMQPPEGPASNAS